jgi:metal-dependent amidase/aminoacylase/carboxypeptidase family protein
METGVADAVAWRRHLHAHPELFDPLMAGDDFSAYLRALPSCFFFVGAGGEGSFPHHHPRFTIDEAALPVLTETTASAALCFLNAAPVTL